MKWFLSERLVYLKSNLNFKQIVPHELEAANATFFFFSRSAVEFSEHVSVSIVKVFHRMQWIFDLNFFCKSLDLLILTLDIHVNGSENDWVRKLMHGKNYRWKIYVKSFCQIAKLYNTAQPLLTVEGIKQRS